MRRAHAIGRHLSRAAGPGPDPLPATRNDAADDSVVYDTVIRVSHPAPFPPRPSPCPRSPAPSTCHPTPPRRLHPARTPPPVPRLTRTAAQGGAAFEAEGHAAGTVLDLAIKDGVIAAIEEPGVIPPNAGAEEVDATDLLLCPGLIDIHAHVFTGMTPLGVDPDEWCLGRGCTTIVDAGSAGATTVEGLSQRPICP